MAFLHANFSNLCHNHIITYCLERSCYSVKSLLPLFLLLASLLGSPAQAAPQLTEIAQSDFQWTGVAVSQTGRIFVNYPTWNDYPKAFRVAELVKGQPVPYPNPELNRHFVCVQSVVVDKENQLWILDPAKLKGQPVAASGARLYQVDLANNELRRVYVFPPEAALPQSYLNDVRIDTRRHFAYLTDSSLGGILVLDLDNGDAWRALTDIPEVKANLDAIDFASTGRNTHVSQSDGLELSANGNTLYFTALGGNVLYQVPTEVLRNRGLTVAQRQKAINVLNHRNVPTDGMLLHQGRLYMADLPKEALYVFDLKTKKGQYLPLSQPIRWADSFAAGPDGNIYFTTSQINYPKEQRVRYGLYRLKP